jgi:hypothetical protein
MVTATYQLRVAMPACEMGHVPVALSRTGVEVTSYLTRSLSLPTLTVFMFPAAGI